MLTVTLGLMLFLVLGGTLAGALVCALDRRRQMLRYEQLRYQGMGYQDLTLRR